MAQYELWKSMLREGIDVPFWQEFYVKFYQAFIEATGGSSILRVWEPR